LNFVLQVCLAEIPVSEDDQADSFHAEGRGPSGFSTLTWGTSTSCRIAARGHDLGALAGRIRMMEDAALRGPRGGYGGGPGRSDRMPRKSRRLRFPQRSSSRRISSEMGLAAGSIESYSSAGTRESPKDDPDPLRDARLGKNTHSTCWATGRRKGRPSWRVWRSRIAQGEVPVFASPSKRILALESLADRPRRDEGYRGSPRRGLQGESSRS
jgi:hypothetical protein